MARLPDCQIASEFSLRFTILRLALFSIRGSLGAIDKTYHVRPIPLRD